MSKTNWGTAFGKGMMAYTNARNNRENNERADARSDAKDEREELAYKERAEERSLRVSALKAELKEKNSPQAQRMRAQEMDLKQQRMNLEKRTMDGMYGNAHDQQVQNEISGIKKQMVQEKKVTAADKAFGDHFQTYIDGGNADFTGINNFVNSEPLLKEAYPNPIVRYNPNDPNHARSLGAYNEHKVGIAGFTGEEGAYDGMFPGTEQSAKDGLVGFDAVTGKLVDIQMMSNMVGATKRASQHQVGKVQQKEDNQNTTYNTKHAKETAIRKSYEIQKPTIDTYNGANAEELVANATYFKMPINPEVQAVVDSNKEKMSEYKDQVVEQTFNDLMSTVNNGTATPQQVAKATSMVGGLDKDRKKAAYLAIQKGKDSIAVANVFDKPIAQPQEMRTLESIEVRNTGMPGTEKLKTHRTLLRSNAELVDGLNGALVNLKDISDGPDGLVSGFGANLIIKGASKDLKGTNELLGMLTKKTNELSKMLDMGEFSINNISEGQLLNTIKMQTTIGRLVADYVKQTSGQSVTEGEFERLQGIIAGAANGDPKAMAMALQTFRDGTIKSITSDNNGVNDFKVRNSLPATSYELKDIGDNQVDYVSQIDSTGGVLNPTSTSTGTGNDSVNTKGISPAQEKRAAEFKAKFGGV